MKDKTYTFGDLPMSALVTGGSGFIGKHLCTHLKTIPHVEVTSYDLDQGEDILNYDHLDRIVSDYGITHIFHLAAQSRVGPGETNPYMDIDINIKGMLNVLKVCEKYKLKLLFTSSGAIYGQAPVPQKEDMLPTPLANYGVSKLAAEFYLKKWVYAHDLDARIVRFSSVYGLGRGPYGPVNAFIAQTLDGGPITIYGDGETTRDMIYVYDAIIGMMIAMEYGDPGEVYNIGLGTENTVTDVALRVSTLTNTRITFVKGPKATKFDIPRSCYDIKKMKKLGFKTIFNLFDGILETLIHETRAKKEMKDK